MASGEPQGDLYILLRGDMHVLDTDRRSFLFKVPEGRVFGEAVALRRIEVRVGHEDMEGEDKEPQDRGEGGAWLWTRNRCITGPHRKSSLSASAGGQQGTTGRERPLQVRV